ncbi:RNA polymerase sigma factor RpoE [Labilithrix luteola]|uniref:RNA polymerase sigma factor RpoE n=1 Tax=Labilithrix luteola TaxID=1391654 RepID=A0A0K1QFH6_9BACT|nr:RNA polymerase sigma factor RpoE [Labilithrix luteola]
MHDERLRTAISAHYGALRRAIRRVGVPEFEVDDVAQEAFLVFHRKAPSIHPKAERTFLYQSAFRIALSRRRGFARRREELEPAFEQFVAARPNPEEEMSQQQSLEILDGILSAMPLELSMIFTLCEIEQLSVPDAAEILDTPLGTATSRLRRAREVFAKLAGKVRASLAKGGAR